MENAIPGKMKEVNSCFVQLASVVSENANRVSGSDDTNSIQLKLISAKFFHQWLQATGIPYLHHNPGH